MFQGLPQGAPQIAQGASLYILNRKEPSVNTATVVSVSQPHVAKAAQTNPALALQGFVVDLTLSVGNETTTVEFPVNSASANYPDKGWFVSNDRLAVTREIESMANMSRQILSQVPMHQKIVQGCEALLIQVSPEKQKEAQQAEEIAALKAQIEEMKRGYSDTGNKLDKVLALLAVDSPRNSKKKED
jgi:hypothetical protein